jgi:hypothetical protein
MRFFPILRHFAALLIERRAKAFLELSKTESLVVAVSLTCRGVRALSGVQVLSL